MPLTFAAAKTEVARNVGGAGITSQETNAGTAIVEAIRDFDSRPHDWEFKARDLPTIALQANEPEYALLAPGSSNSIKKIHTVRLLGDKRTLGYARQRLVDRVMRDHESTGIPIAYRDVRGPIRVIVPNSTTSGTALSTTHADGFRDRSVVPGMLVSGGNITETNITVASITSDAAAVLSSAPAVASSNVSLTFSGALRVRLFKTPNGSASGPMLVRVFESIQDSYAAGDYLDFPERYLNAIISRARYYFLLNIDPEDPRIPVYFKQSNDLIDQAALDDGGNPDEDIAFVPYSEWGAGAMGPDPSTFQADLDL